MSRPGALNSIERFIVKHKDVINGKEQAFLLNQLIPIKTRQALRQEIADRTKPQLRHIAPFTDYSINPTE